MEVFERDFDLFEFIVIPFDGDDDDVSGSCIFSFNNICDESLFDWESIELSLSKRLFEWKPLNVEFDKSEGVNNDEEGSGGGGGGGKGGQNVGNNNELVFVVVVGGVETVCTSCFIAFGSSRKIRIRRNGSRPFCVNNSHCFGRARISLNRILILFYKDQKKSLLT